jgi:geranylgeranyl pyrophosphate synthase
MVSAKRGAAKVNKAGQVAVSIVVAIITLATISVIISRNSKAPDAIRAVASGLANVVSAAVSPQNPDGRI